MKTIARCERCGRGFVWLPDRKRIVDAFYPDNITLGKLPTGTICGARIVPVEEPPPQPEASN